MGVGMSGSLAVVASTGKANGDSGGGPPASTPPSGHGGSIPPQFAEFWKSHAHDVAERVTSHAGPVLDTVTRTIVNHIRQTAKISPERVLDAVWDANGKAVWLEIGKHDPTTDKGSGMMHILQRHLDDFQGNKETGNKGIGIREADIKNEIMAAVQGKDNRVFVGISSNGYIVEARPKKL
jgi:hypothetical protein